MGKQEGTKKKQRASSTVRRVRSKVKRNKRFHATDPIRQCVTCDHTLHPAEMWDGRCRLCRQAQRRRLKYGEGPTGIPRARRGRA